MQRKKTAASLQEGLPCPKKEKGDEGDQINHERQHAKRRYDMQQAFRELYQMGFGERYKCGSGEAMVGHSLPHHLYMLCAVWADDSWCSGLSIFQMIKEFISHSETSFGLLHFAAYCVRDILRCHCSLLSK